MENSIISGEVIAIIAVVVLYYIWHKDTGGFSGHRKSKHKDDGHTDIL